MVQASKKVYIENWNVISTLVEMSIGTDKGSWWAAPDFGSELHLLREKGKVDGNTAGTLKRMLQECLFWIVADGLVKRIICSAERTGKNEISYTVEVIQPDKESFFIKEVWNGIKKG
jgi:phage gp46-like protein